MQNVIESIQNGQKVTQKRKNWIVFVIAKALETADKMIGVI